MVKKKKKKKSLVWLSKEKLRDQTFLTFFKKNGKDNLLAFSLLFSLRFFSSPFFMAFKYMKIIFLNIFFLQLSRNQT